MTEICVQVREDLAHVINMLKSLDYVFDERYVIHDIYYTTLKKSDLKTVDYKNLLNQSLIIRKIDGNSGINTYIVFKNKTIDNKGNVINEIKTKLKIDDEEKAKTIFTNIGMTCWCDYINENINESAYAGNNEIKSVVVGSQVSSIGDSAFSGCASLSTVNITGEISTIGEKAFKGCRTLTSINLPNSISKIEGEAFSGCEQLKLNQYELLNPQDILQIFLHVTQPLI